MTERWVCRCTLQPITQQQCIRRGEQLPQGPEQTDLGDQGHDKQQESSSSSSSSSSIKDGCTLGLQEYTQPSAQQRAPLPIMQALSASTEEWLSLPGSTDCIQLQCLARQSHATHKGARGSWGETERNHHSHTCTSCANTNVTQS
jgi:hypothetical protein